MALADRDEHPLAVQPFICEHTHALFRDAAKQAKHSARSMTSSTRCAYHTAHARSRGRVNLFSGSKQSSSATRAIAPV